MAKTTVYNFAKHCMADHEFSVSGIPTNERRYLDAIGFSYTVNGGSVEESGEDLKAFYEAMAILKRLNDKYSANT